MDIMDPNHACTVRYRKKMRSNRSAKPPTRVGRRDFGDETFAGGAHKERQPEAMHLGEPGDCGHALLRSLCEPNAGVEHDLMSRYSDRCGYVQGMLEKACNIPHDVEF